MKKVAILGGGIYQVPLIRRAIDRGFRVCVASMKDDDPGMKLAHERWKVNLTDKEAIAGLVMKHHADAVVTTGTEFSLPAIGYVHETLGLPGITQETARISTNKALAQKKFAEYGVPAAAFRQVATPEEALDAAEVIGWPVYAKAPGSSGSRGVSMVSTPDKMEPAFHEAAKYSKDGVILVEEMLTGTEFGAQVIVINGYVRECICHNDTVTPPPVTVPVGHSLPFRGTDEIQREAFRVCAASVSALGIDNAVCNADLIATPDGVRMFEIGARIGATGLAETVLLHHGVDLYDIALSMALGEKPAIEMKKGPAAAYRIIAADRSGILSRCTVPDRIHDLSGIEEIHFDYKKGAHVRKFITGPDRIGHVLVTADTADDAERLAEQIIGMLDIEVLPEEHD